MAIEAFDTCCLEIAGSGTFERPTIFYVGFKIDVNYCRSEGFRVTLRDTQEESLNEIFQLITQLESLMRIYELERARFNGDGVAFRGKWLALQVC